MLTISNHSASLFYSLVRNLNCPVESNAEAFLKQSTLHPDKPYSSRISLEDFLKVKKDIFASSQIRECLFKVVETKSILKAKLLLHNLPEHTTIGQIIVDQTNTRDLFSQEWYSKLVYSQPHYEIIFSHNLDMALPWEFTLEKLTDIIHGLRNLLGKSWNPLALRFNHRYPKRSNPEDIRRIEQFAGCILHFNCGVNSICVEKSNIRQNVDLINRPRSEIDVMDPIDANEAMLGIQNVSIFPDKVRDTLRKMEQKKLPSINDVCTDLTIHPRQLQRTLKQYGFTFRNLCDEVLHERFEEFTKDKALSFTEISSKLGFSQKPALHRALRRWKKHQSLES